jgi:hypothetical protein
MSSTGPHILSSQGGQPALIIEQLANLKLENERGLTKPKQSHPSHRIKQNVVQNCPGTWDWKQTKLYNFPPEGIQWKRIMCSR